MNKQYRVKGIKCVGWCEFVFVFVCVCVPTTKFGSIVLEQRLIEIFVLKTEGVAGGWTELYSEGAAWFVLVSEWWWVVS